MSSSNPKSVLITGTTGLVGRSLMQQLAGQCTLYSMGRSKPEADIVHIDAHFGDNQHWLEAVEQILPQVEVVVHCAARVHVMQDSASNPLQQFTAVNTDATLALAKAAASAGVKRFIFISSIKVNGEYTLAGVPFTAADKVAPTDPYAHSKWQAERGLLQLGQHTEMEIVIIRPPLVYGPGVKANFRALAAAVKRGYPLPFGAIDNKRSLVALQNLVSLIQCCLTHPAASGQTLLVSDGIDLSSAELVRLMAAAQGVKARVWPVPGWLLQSAATLFGKAEQYRRVVGSLQLDITATCNRLNWSPPLTPEQAITKALEN
ncbi:NAD-dependent epimerase/dehydratase family protein [Rheinheimera maricola]|uniref:NAD-dependent epimerase/dehydratase family protein n=1 Tax=Rheinheimera maricola TaxID=2793282 RepID=A0ABS7X413_9GAMM|nr:NAD-dependent epimerase/dehydratase family protein [Rheinheimera maricola]MBZ9610298.1 NAD-dependent epimerase/dehydratase family protein [Rheinheimera maricola]